MSSTDTGSEVEASRSVDEVREGLLTTLRAELGDELVGSHIDKGDIWVRVASGSWHRAVETCKTKLGCDYFCFLSGIDWMPATAPNPEAAAADDATADDDDAAAAALPAAAPAPGDGAWATGLAGGETRFQVFARLASTTKHYGITLKADLADDAPAVQSIVDLYRGAEWHEREAWEMYGFDFAGHPALRHLFLPGEFEGHPLRKDFPLLAREVKPWPGLVDVEAMPGGDDEGDGGDVG